MPLDMMRRTVERNMLRFQVGQAIFCPACKRILDTRRAVGLDFYRGEELGGSKVVCTSCYDAKLGGGKLEAQLEGTGLSLKVIDGRELFRRPARRKK